MDSKQHQTSILMLPWLAHGHISPFFELAKKLSHKFHIYFCSTPINLKPIRENLHVNNPFNSIQLVDLHLHSSPELPPHYHTTKDLPPHLMSTLKAAFDMAKPDLFNILKTLKPNLVIYDFLQPCVPDAAHELEIEAVMYCTCGAAFSSFFTHYGLNPDKEFPFPQFHLPEPEFQKLFQLMNDKANGISNLDRFLNCLERSSNMVLIKTSREIEDDYNEYLSQLVGKEMVPVGALIQEPAYKDDHDDDDEVIVEWLTRKQPDSVVFVSFGSEYFLSKEEIEEIAYGLEHSEINFIWVVRFHGGDKNISIHDVLPRGFVERVGDRGMVIEGWAPQARILGDSSIAGFVSHCGWSSTLEGLMFGVPIIAMPMQLDQPLNAKLVVELGVGIEVPRENGRLERKEIAKVVKGVLLGEEGKEIRRKAKELSLRMRENGDQEMDLVMEKIVKLIKKPKNGAASNEQSLRK